MWQAKAGTRPGLSRRWVLMTAAVAPVVGMAAGPARGAEFSYKLATGQDPMHPVNTRAQDALTRIREGSSGRLDIRLFPANQLGSDTDLLTQVRNGSIEFL